VAYVGSGIYLARPLGRPRPFEQFQSKGFIMSESQSVQQQFSTVEVVSFCLENNLNAEMVGKWVWVTFAEKPARQMCEALHRIGFVFSRRHRKWAHNCGHPTKSAFASDPFSKYPCRPIVAQS